MLSTKVQAQVKQIIRACFLIKGVELNEEINHFPS